MKMDTLLLSNENVLDCTIWGLQYTYRRYLTVIPNES